MCTVNYQTVNSEQKFVLSAEAGSAMFLTNFKHIALIGDILKIISFPWIFYGGGTPLTLHCTKFMGKI